MAAEEALRGLAKQLGPSILRGRIEMLDNPDFLLQRYEDLMPPTL